ncbi:MAG TPA: HTTM domain-containing protein [Vicinamibacterales bacterium]|nr:HTTM domain-containing protein [Vicinamibacterales bacterium]
MISLATLADSWSAFFHAPVSPTTLSLFRIVFAAILLVNAGGLVRDLRFLYGPDGALGDAYRAGGFRTGRVNLLHYCTGRMSWVWALLAIHAVAALLLLLGVHARMAAAVSFVTLTTLQSRNPLVTYGGDDVLRVMCFLLILTPSGESLSIDRFRTAGTVIGDATVSAWSWRLMQIQVAVLYVKAALAKLAGASWYDGRAVLFATEARDFQRRRLPVWARRHGWLRAGSWATVVTEFALGTLIWVREFRGATLAAGVVMHLILERYLNLYLFGAVMIACLMLFLDPASVERTLRTAGIQ